MASRDRDDAMAGLLKRNLAGDAGAGNDCPAPDILAAYFERSLDADETAHVELHLSECARCREQLAALGRAEAEVAVTSVEGARRKAPRASWMWDWRWLAPAAAVLVIAAVWATRRPALTQITNHVAQPPASLAVSQLARPVQPPPEPEKKKTLSRVSPAPAVVPATPPKLPPQSESVAVNPVDREKSAEVERSPLQSIQSSKSVQDLPLVGRNYTALDSLSKKAPEPQRKSAEDAANAPLHATNESVTAESQAETVQSSAAGAPLPPKAENGMPAGAVGGAISSGTANAKQERAARERLGAGRSDPDNSGAARVLVCRAERPIRKSGGASGTRASSSVPQMAAPIGKESRRERTPTTQPDRRRALMCAGSWAAMESSCYARRKAWRTIPPPADADFVDIAARMRGPRR